MSTVIVIPVLNRPAQVARTLESIEAATPEPHTTLFVLSPGFPEELQAVQEVEAKYLVTPWPNGPGDYAKKINWAYRETTEPYLFQGADDLHFHPGWLSAALRHMGNDRIGVVGTNDLGNRRVIMGQHSTHSLIRREYIRRLGTIDEPNKIFCELYSHEFCDDELVATAKSRYAYAHARNSIVEHLHPHWGKGDPKDPTYPPRTSQRLLDGGVIFRSRRHLWQKKGPISRVHRVRRSR